MSAPMKLSTGDWTQLAGAGFGAATVQALPYFAADVVPDKQTSQRKPAVMIELSAAKPTIADAGIVLAPGDRQTVTTGNGALALWGRPYKQDCEARVRVMIGG